MTPREIADAKKRTCSRCSQGHHELCRLAMCAHYLCVADEAEQPIAPAAPAAPQRLTTAALLEWGDPPPKRGAGGKVLIRPSVEQAELLRLNPTRYARIAVFAGKSSATSLAGKLNKKKLATPPGRWEYDGATLPEGGSGLWCRFLGDELQ